MAKQHGNKVHYQVLLGPHRSEVLEQQAEERGLRATAYARDLLYAALQRNSTASEYAVAEAQDEALRRVAIQRQVEGRVKAQRPATCANVQQST